MRIEVMFYSRAFDQTEVVIVEAQSIDNGVQIAKARFYHQLARKGDWLLWGISSVRKLAV